jgi:acetaldehyde/propanal dehydrogenase
MVGQGDEREHGHLRRAGDDPDGGRGQSRAAVAYGEIVATVSSPSRRVPARARTSTSSRAPPRSGVEKVGGAKEGKAIIVINPAEPPLIMRDTIHCLTVDEPDQAAITKSMHEMVEGSTEVRAGLHAEERAGVRRQARVGIWKSRGLGDFLPKYAGNLDIMTAAGLRTAEMFAQEILAANFVPPAA